MDKKLNYVQSVMERIKSGQLSRREGIALLHKAGVSAMVAALALRMIDADAKQEATE